MVEKKTYLKEYEYIGVPKTRIMLINGLLSIMEEKSIDKISIRELSDFSHVSRKTYYRHYNKKEDVIEDYIKLVFEMFLNYEAQFSHTNTKQKIYNVFEWIRNNKHYFEPFSYEFLISMLTDNYEAFRDLYLERFDERIITHLFEKNDPLLKYYENFQWVGFIKVIFIWLKSGMVETSEQMSDLCMRMMNL